LRNAKDRARSRRNRADRSGALSVDLQKRQRRSYDDDADERKELAIVSVRKDGDPPGGQLVRFRQRESRPPERPHEAG
jgi:hypothetical protein